MTKTTLTITACAALLWAGTALAAPSAQQQCDYTRITAWKTYQSCVEAVVLKDLRGTASLQEYVAFARCRHSYFKRWDAFQNPSRQPSLVGSVCVGPRFTDNGDGTVTDNLTVLVWEKKDNLDGMVNLPDPHDGDTEYTWSTGAPYSENGGAFTEFLNALNNGSGFAGANGWRLPTVAEIQTILHDFPCTGRGMSLACQCSLSPCLAFDDSSTQANTYWTATSYIGAQDTAWFVDFQSGFVEHSDGFKAHPDYVRAVRGGL